MVNAGVVGLGNMGRGMALSLQRAGFAVTGTDASADVRRACAAAGLRVVATLAEAVAEAEFVVLSLPTAAVVSEVVTGPGGILAAARPGTLVIDTSTSHPETTRQLAARLRDAGMALVDAPVSGGAAKALTGELGMMVGGSHDDVARAQPVLAALAAKQVHVGEVGAGHVAKIANNLMCAAHLLVAAEVTRLAESAGVPAAKLLAAINAASGRSAVTEVNYPNWILNDAFDSGFTMKLMRKDVRLAAELVAASGLALPLTGAVTDLWQASAATLADAADFNRIVELAA